MSRTGRIRRREDIHSSPEVIMAPRFTATLSALGLALAACTGADRHPAAPAAPASAALITAADACDAGTIPSSECAALIAFYNAAGGDDWVQNAGWGVGNPCAWHGVVCTEGDHGAVLNLFFDLNGLVGTLPPEIGDLTSLHQLTAPSNALGGPLPEALGTLDNLANLILPRNDFSGPIPASFGNLDNLLFVELGENQLSGPIPPELGGMSSLRRLGLDDNALTGGIPPELGQLEELRILDLSGNQLTGSVPEELAALDQLISFRVDGNPLEGLLPLGIAAAADGMVTCLAGPGTAIWIPDIESYRATDTDLDDTVCGLGFTPIADVGEDALDDLDELVPETLNPGQANALKSKLENAIAKADAGQYHVAINLAEAFVSQLEEMVANGVLTAGQAAPFLEQAAVLIEGWTGLL
jgi:hypothetical protein